MLQSRVSRCEYTNCGDDELVHVQTKKEIEATLIAAGLRPRKRFGQHFLIDGNLMRKLVESADPQPCDILLEVGPGTGGLTDLLETTRARIVCVEIDRDLHAILGDRFRRCPTVTVLLADVLDGKHRLDDGVIAQLNQPIEPGGEWKLVANLPYQVATPLVMNLLLDYPQVRRLCFTVQAEVGDRITAAPNSKAYGPLSILCQLLCEIHTIARIPPECFWPRPEVDSVMLRLRSLENPQLRRADVHDFAKFVRGVFEHRRKTLRSALGYVVEPAARDRICAPIDSKRRPESITITEWVEMFRAADTRSPSF